LKETLIHSVAFQAHSEEGILSQAVMVLVFLQLCRNCVLEETRAPSFKLKQTLIPTSIEQRNQALMMLTI